MKLESNKAKRILVTLTIASGVLWPFAGNAAPGPAAVTPGAVTPGTAAVAPGAVKATPGATSAISGAPAKAGPGHAGAGAGAKPGPDPAAVNGAWGELAQVMTTVSNNKVVEQMQQLHDKLKNYKWRTVYEFGQVSKSPMPGTRLKLVKMPTMSQMDAETYLLSTSPDLPALNCPVSHMGGPAGRPIVLSQTVTIGTQTKTVAVTLTDEKIKLLFLKAAPNPVLGNQAFDTYLTLKNNTCAAIYNTAQLTFRYQKFKGLSAKWDECKKDGVSISEWSHSQKFDFPGNRTRHAAVGGGVMFKCGLVYKGDASDAIAYQSWFKWSDDKPIPLNILQTLRDAPASSSHCPKACIPLIGDGGLSASICMGMDPGLPSDPDAPLPFRFGAKFHSYSRNKELCTRIINVPAPFGVASSLGEMADTAKQQALQKMQAQLMSVLPINKDMKSKIGKIQNAVN